MSQLTAVICLAALCADPTSDIPLAMAHNANFVVSAPSPDLADAILKKANELRRRIALEWLGEELPPSVGFTSIHARLSQSDRNKTLAANERSKYNLVFLSTSRSRMLGSALAHEIVHCVLAARYRGRLPAWASEGAASLEDDPERVAICRRTLEWFARTDNWPSLKELLGTPAILSFDQASYAFAGSLTQYLLSLGGKQKFLAFAQAGKRQGWDAALQTYYSIASTQALQSSWQAWLGHKLAQKAVVGGTAAASRAARRGAANGAGAASSQAAR